MKRTRISLERKDNERQTIKKFPGINMGLRMANSLSLAFIVTLLSSYSEGTSAFVHTTAIVHKSPLVPSFPLTPWSAQKTRRIGSLKRSPRIHNHVCTSSATMRRSRRRNNSHLAAASSAELMAGASMSFLALQFACQPVLTRAFASTKLVKTTFVVAQDILRFLVCASLVTFTCGWASLAGQWSVASSLVGAGLPASLYAIQNYCSLMAYQNLSPITYNVLNQTKTLSAAFFCYFLLSKPQSVIQIGSLLLLLASALVMEEVLPIRRFLPCDPACDECKIPEEFANPTPPQPATRWTKGVLPILMASLISGLAGTLCQQSLQEFGRHPLLFSMEISFFSSLFLLFSLFTGNPDGKKIANGGGIKQGWTRKTWIPLATNALGGILVGLVTKYAGSVRKGFALVVGLLLSGVLQNARGEDGRVTLEQWAGGILAAVSIWLHMAFPIAA